MHYCNCIAKKTSQQCYCTIHDMSVGFHLSQLTRIQQTVKLRSSTVWRKQQMSQTATTTELTQWQIQ